MKNRIIACAVALTMGSFAGSRVMAQEAQTLLGSDKKINLQDFGWFVAPSVSLTQMDQSSAALFNIRGGISYKDRWSLGAYYNTSLNQIRPHSETFPNIYMDYWSLGGFAEYTVLSKKLFHVSFPLSIGFGEVQMDNEEGSAGLGEAYFMVIEPSALLEMNVHKNFRLNVGAGYRYISSMNYRNFNEQNLSGPLVNIGFKFGVFK